MDMNSLMQILQKFRGQGDPSQGQQQGGGGMPPMPGQPGLPQIPGMPGGMPGGSGAMPVGMPGGMPGQNPLMPNQQLENAVPPEAQTPMDPRMMQLMHHLGLANLIRNRRNQALVDPAQMQ
jgi:hypothetical protein